MDAVFILIILTLYAGTHWLIWALSRLGGPPVRDAHELPTSPDLRYKSPRGLE